MWAQARHLCEGPSGCSRRLSAAGWPPAPARAGRPTRPGRLLLRACSAGVKDRPLGEPGGFATSELAAPAPTALAPSPAPSGQPEDQRWFRIVGLSALVVLICSVDRAAISVAILPMSEQYHWTDATKGAINSAFFIGYTLTNLFGGYLATSLPAKQVLGAGVVLWSLFTILTPTAAAFTFLPVLLVVRAVMGAGEGLAYPCVQTLVRGWVPASGRTRSLALIYSGGSVGTIIALLTAPLIIQNWGWPSVFQLYGAMGLLWLLLWKPWVDEPPPLFQQQRQQQQKSAAVAQQPSGKVSFAGFTQLPWRMFLTNKPFLAIMTSHMAFGVGHYIVLSWLPTYYFEAFDVNMEQSATLSVLPWVFTVACNNAGGWAADGLANSGALTLTQTRKLMQVVGTVGPAGCLLYLALGGQQHGDVNSAVALMTATLALGAFQSAGFASNHQDISSRYAAILFGVTNALSSLMGSFSVFATGLILDSTHSWSLVFELVAGCYLLGAVFYISWASAEEQFD